MGGAGLSRAAYRLLLRAYPREFRERFAHDLELDFVQLAASRGHCHAWRRVLNDLVKAVPLTARDAHGERARRARVLKPIHPPGGSRMGSALFDVRHAIRGLAAAPTFTIVTILTLALGIGANSAIFSLVNAVLLRPLGYHQPERLLLIYEAIPESGVPRFDVSPPDYLDLVGYQSSFTSIGAYRNRSLELSGAGEPEQIAGAELTSSVFPILGVAPSRGRVFLPDEDEGESNVVVISEALAARRFGGRDPVGERLLLDRVPYTVVGVMPASFEFPKRGALSNAEPADVWLPLVFNPFERRARGMMYNHTVIGRLKEGMTPEQAAADTAALARRIQDNYPPAIRHAFTLAVGTTRLEDEIFGRVRRPLLMLLGAVGLVLLVACANVANLILSRSVTRQREIGIRAALGAGTLRLFQVLLLEGVMLAAAGGLLGLALSYWTLRAVPAVLVTSLPGLGDVPLDWRVLAFTAVLSLGCAAAFAVVPLGAGLRRDLHDVLREGSGRTAGGRRQHRAQSALVVSSVAFAFVLLAGAGLLLRSFAALTSLDTGLRSSGVLSLQLRLPPAGYNVADRIRRFHTMLEESLRAEPGVRTAVIATDLPLDDDGERRAFTPEHSPVRGLPPSVAVTWVHGDYFGTFGVPILRGRNFTPDELGENRQVAIVNQRIARTYWPGEDPIGKRLKWGLPVSTTPWQTVIGVVGDVPDGPPGTEPMIHVYVPFTEVPDQALAAPIAGLLRRMVIAVRSDGDPALLTGPIRHAVAALDPALALFGVQTLEQLEHERAAPQRFSTVVLGGFAAGALLLAAIGLYGVLAFAVSQRRREIGVRLALGAPPHQVLRLIVGQGMALVAIGLAVGGLAAAFATRLIRAQLFDTNVYDPLTFLSVPLLLAIVGLAACYLPARRAAGVDPTIALRVE